jgi:hypothetical protein
MQDINPLKPAIEIVIPNAILLLILAAIGLIIFIVWWIKRIKSTVKPIEDTLPHLNLKSQTLKSLSQLDQLLTDGDFATFYLTLTQIIKNYVNLKHHQHISQLTTTEIHQQLNLDSASKQELTSLLQAFDTAKFAKVGQETNTARKLLRRVEHDITIGLL